MRDHQFDVGDQFNQGALTRVQIDQAEDSLSQRITKLHQQLKSNKLMSTRIRHTLSQQIDVLNTHAQQILRSVDSQAQMDLIIKKTELKAQQIIVSGQLKVVADLVINRIYHSSLTNDQQSTAINEIKTAEQISVEDMDKATNDALIRSAFTTGVNAINGALAKYVADSQINAIDQIKRLVDQAEIKLRQKASIPDDARHIVVRQLKMLKQHAVDNLLTSVNFVQLAKTRQHYINQLKSITSDKHHVIKALVTFSQFMRQVDDVIISLSLSSDDKMRIEGQINQDQDRSVKALKQSFQLDSKYLTGVKHQITSTIVNAVSQHYQRMIAAQTLMLSDDQRQDLTKQIKQTTARINQRPLVEPIKPNLIKALHQLKAVVQQRQTMMYQGQIKQVVNQIKSRIDQLYDLSQVSRDYLKSQIINFGHRIQNHQSDFGLTQQSLHKFFQAQLNFVYKLNLQRDFTSLFRQIRYSYLNRAQQRDLRQRLIAIKNNTRLNYSNQQLFIKNGLNYGLKLDRAQSKNHLTALIQKINSRVDTLTRFSLKPKFAQIRTDFELNVANASQFKDVDHQTQQAENKLCLASYQLKNSVQSGKSQALARLINQIHSKVNDAVLQPDLKQIINDQFDRFFNAKLIRLIDTTNVKDSLDEIKQTVHDRLIRALKLVKRTDVHQLDNLARIANYQLKAYASINYAGKLNQISSHAITQIKGTSDLSWAEDMNQQGWQKLNAFITRIISSVDPIKAQAHQQVKKLMMITKGRLNDHASLLTSNLILMIVNQANTNINRGLNGQAQAEVIRCQSALDSVLRHSYLRTWARVINQATTNVRQLVRVPADAKQRAINRIKIISSRVIPDLKQIDSNKLTQLIRTHQAKIQTIVNQTSYLDPTKRKVWNRLTQLIKHTKQDAKQYQSGKVQSHTIKMIHQLNQVIDRQLSMNDDHQLQQIYQTNFDKLMTLQLKMTRQAQLERFSKAFEQAEVQLQALKFLASRKARQTAAKLNRCYHKTMYDVKHAPDTEYCLHNEQLGERQLNQLVSQSKRYNSHKQRIYTEISAKVNHARNQVSGLRYVQDNDKQSSIQLLKQIQQVAIHQVKKAASHNQIFTIEHYNYRAIQQVMNNVVSANVILAAIQSANDRIAKSNLNSRQKASALKQIHQIINNGLKAQAQPKSTSNGYKDTKKATRTVAAHGFAPRRAPKRHPLVELVNSIRHFFRWLFGKLVQEL